MKTINIAIWIVMILLSCYFAAAVDFTPKANINMQSRYNITNGVDANFTGIVTMGTIKASTLNMTGNVSISGTLNVNDISTTIIGNTSGGAGTYGVYGIANQIGVEGSGNTAGVEGQGNIGVRGIGGTWDIYGAGANASYFSGIVAIGTLFPDAVLHVVNNGASDYGIKTNGTYGLYGYGTNIGLWGYSPAVGIYGNAGDFGVKGTATIGVYGGGSNIGVYANGSNYDFYGGSGNSYFTGNVTAAYFIGNGSLLTGLVNVSTATVNHSNSTDYWNDKRTQADLTINLSQVANADFSCPANTHMIQFNASTESITCQADLGSAVTSNISVNANNSYDIGNSTDWLANVFSNAFYEGGTALSGLYASISEPIALSLGNFSAGGKINGNVNLTLNNISDVTKICFGNGCTAYILWNGTDLIIKNS
jgi:hypothetical protein